MTLLEGNANMQRDDILDYRTQNTKNGLEFLTQNTDTHCEYIMNKAYARKTVMENPINIKTYTY